MAKKSGKLNPVAAATLKDLAAIQAPAFTPGPWGMDSSTFGNAREVYAKSDNLIVAEVHGYHDPKTGKLDRARSDANARLIAAAPDLLDALYGVAFQTQSEVPGGCWCSEPYRKCNPDRHSEACEFARAAIAKAVLA